MPQPVRLAVELTDDQALALAQFVKRAGLSDYRPLARDDDEAYLMRDAGDQVGRALAAAGFAPR